MTTTRTYDELRADLNYLNQFMRINHTILEKKGIYTDLLALSSKAEAKLDAYKLFPIDPYRNRLDGAHRYMTRAWLKIQGPMMTDAEIGEIASQTP
jgi:hypothetical protein